MNLLLFFPFTGLHWAHSHRPDQDLWWKWTRGSFLLLQLQKFLCFCEPACQQIIIFTFSWIISPTLRAAANVRPGWRGREWLAAAHGLQERLLSQPPSHPVVLEGKSAVPHRCSHLCQRAALRPRGSVLTPTAATAAASFCGQRVAGLLLKIKVCLEEQACLLWWKSPKWYLPWLSSGSSLNTHTHTDSKHTAAPIYIHTRTHTHMDNSVLSVDKVTWIIVCIFVEQNITEL